MGGYSKGSVFKYNISVVMWVGRRLVNYIERLPVPVGEAPCLVMKLGHKALLLGTFC